MLNTIKTKCLYLNNHLNKKMRHNFNHHHSINWKWSIILVLIHFTSLLILSLGIQKAGLSNGLITIFLTGFGVTIIAGIVKTFTQKRSFVVNKWFFFWSLINTFIIWLVSLISNFINITNNLLVLLLIALGLVISAYFIHKLRITKTTMIITSVILIVCLFFFNVNTEIITPKSEQSIQTAELTGQSQSFLSNINNFIDRLLSFTVINDNCPEINVPITQTRDLLPFLRVREYEGWTVAPYDVSTQLFGFNWGTISCHKGSKQGQNSEYLYCGDKTSETTMGYIQKTIINKDGSIEETIKKSFVNVYRPIELPPEIKEACKNPEAESVIINSNNLTFKCHETEYIFEKTMCGEDPDVISDREFNEFMNG